MIRSDLYKMFGRRGYRVGAEIGVFKGYNAVNMFSCIEGLKLYMIDPWDGESGVKHPYRGEERYHEVLDKMDPYNAIVLRQYSEYAVNLIDEDLLDFVYIDGDHSYDAVMLDIILWSRKVRPGGIISGHDYGRRKLPGVTQAVNHYAKAHNLKIKTSPGGSWYWEM